MALGLYCGIVYREQQPPESFKNEQALERLVGEGDLVQEANRQRQRQYDRAEAEANAKAARKEKRTLRWNQLWQLGWAELGWKARAGWYFAIASMLAGWIVPIVKHNPQHTWGWFALVFVLAVPALTAVVLALWARRAGGNVVAKIAECLIAAPFKVGGLEDRLAATMTGYKLTLEFKNPPSIDADRLQSVLATVDPAVRVKVEPMRAPSRFNFEVERIVEPGGDDTFPLHTWVLRALDEVLPTLHAAEPIAALWVH